MLQPSSTTSRREHLLKRVSETDFDSHGRRLELRIAGVPLALLTRSEALEHAARDYFREFLLEVAPSGVDRVAPVAEISLDPLDSAMPGHGQCDLWEDEDAEYSFHGLSVLQRDFVARRVPTCGDPSAPLRVVALVGPESVDALHNLLRWFLPSLLIGRGALLMHAGGVIRDGRGYVFFGASGAGKSTSTGLIRAADAEAELLGDDSVIIQWTGAELVLHAAPLGCGYSRVAPRAWSGPLAGLFALNQHMSHALRTLTLAEGVAALLASAMNVSFDESLDERFALALEIARSRAGIRELRFRRDSGFWPLVLESGRESCGENAKSIPIFQQTAEQTAEMTTRRIHEQRPNTPEFREE